MLQSVDFRPGEEDLAGFEEWMDEGSTYSLSELSVFPLLKKLEIYISTEDFTAESPNIAMAPQFQGVSFQETLSVVLRHGTV